MILFYLRFKLSDGLGYLSDNFLLLEEKPLVFVYILFQLQAQSVQKFTVRLSGRLSFAFMDAVFVVLSGRIPEAKKTLMAAELSTDKVKYLYVLGI